MKQILILVLAIQLISAKEVKLKSINLHSTGAETCENKAPQKNLEIPGNPNELFQDLEELYIGKVITPKLVREIESYIVKFFEKNDRPFVIAAAGEQDVSEGCLAINVIESSVGEVCVKNNCYFSDENILRWTCLQTGERLDRREFYDNLNWLNRNPYRIVNAVFSASKTPNATDVDLIVRDRLPLRIYTGIDNTGTDFTGNNRLFAGLNWGNVFGTEQVIAYQYTTDTHFKKLQAHTGYYEIPLPWRNVLTFYGGYSYINTKFDFPGFDANRFTNDGYSAQLSMRYTIPLPTYRSFTQEFLWGSDWKRMNNAVIFNAVSIDPKTVNLFQLMAKYNLGYDSGRLRLNAEIEAFVNPGKWLPHQSNSDYESIRPFAKNVYFYTRGMVTGLWNFIDPFYFYVQLRGQGATANLLPSEQLGIGGIATVRGYKERQLNGDNGFILNAEIQSAPISIVSHMRKRSYED